MLNTDIFGGQLETPVITIQSTPKAYGHVTVAKVWEVKHENQANELNIGAGTLSRPIEEIVATMVHEMVHLENLQNGVQDTSRGGTYHNKAFKDLAEKRMLKIDHDQKYGWTITSVTEDLLNWCAALDLVDIQINRNEGYNFGGMGKGIVPPVAGKTPKKKSSTRKYVCPECGQTVRATKAVNIICGDCNETMQCQEG